MDMKSWLLSFAVVALGLAGCLGDQSDPTGEVHDGDVIRVAPLPKEIRVEPLDTLADDGAMIRGHVYLPPGEQLATILLMTPYAGNADHGTGQLPLAAVYDDEFLYVQYGMWLEEGYAVAIVSVRGTGESDGCLQWGNDRDSADINAVIEHLASMPWSDGAVGMYGHSYVAWTQYMALRNPSPALKAVIPASSVLDAWTLVTHNGAAFGPWMYPLWDVGVSGPGLFGVVNPNWDINPEPRFQGNTAQHALCPERGDDLRESHLLYVDGDKTDWWRMADYREAISQTTVPMLVTNGIALAEGHINQIDGLWELMPEDRRLVLGQHGHDFASATHPDWFGMAKDWMHHYLRDGPAVPVGVVDWQDDSGTWHTTPNWPPEGTSHRLWLGDGTLATEATLSSSQTFLSVHQDPLPDTCTQIQAVYVSPPLAADVLLAGNFHLNVSLTSTAPDGNLAAFLYHVPELLECPGGYMDATPPFWYGRTLFGEDEVIAPALSDLRHRGHLTSGMDFPVGTAEQIRMTSVAFAAFVPAGERLVLAIGGDSIELIPDPFDPILTVHSGPAATLDLHVVEGDLVFE